MREFETCIFFLFTLVVKMKRVVHVECGVLDARGGRTTEVLTLLVN